MVTAIGQARFRGQHTGAVAGIGINKMMRTFIWR